MEWIKGLPFVDIANAVVILLTGFLAAFGLQRGKKPGAPASPPASSHVEVAGALVDASSIKILSAAVEGHSLSLTETRATGREVVEAVWELCRRVEQLEEEIREHRNEMARRR